MSAGVITAAMFGGMLLLLATGLPITFAMGGVALITSLVLWGSESLRIMVYSFLHVQDMYGLAAIPGFIFTGVIIQRSGIAEEMFDVVHKWLGGTKGGLAAGVVVICAMFAAIVGVSAAGTVAMGIVALPELLRKDYNKNLALGTIMGAGGLGILIPPSVTFALFGVVADQSIGKLFAAGIFPGLILASLFVIYILIRSHVQPHLAPAIPKEERFSLRAKVFALKAIVWPLVLIFVVLGLILLGITSATEASGVGALGAIVVAVIHRRFDWKMLEDALRLTMRIVGMITWIIAAALAFASIYSGLGAIDLVANLIKASGLGAKGIIAIMLLVWLVMGCFMDAPPMLFITGPLFIPLVQSLDLSLIWFGVLFVLAVEMALLSPPFGLNLFYMRGVVLSDEFPFKGAISMADIYRSVFPFILCQMITVVLVVLFPEIALYLAERMAF